MTQIINSKRSDLEKISICHQSAFPDSLSSKMGIKYLMKMIDWYLADEKRFLFHIEDDKGRCIGYCGGMIQDGTQATGSASGMIQYSFNEAVKALMLRPWLLFHKELTAKYNLIIKNVKMRFKKKTNAGKGSEVNKSKIKAPVAGLVVIGVADEYRGKGYGSLLLKEFENRANGMNIKKMELSVRNDNSAAIKSYERNGWVKSKLTGNSLEMHKDLN